MARLYLNPVLAANLKNDIQLGVKLDDKATKYTRDKFSCFDNKLAVVSFAQQGAFGMKLGVAAKVDLTGLDIKTLQFYSYDKATNLYAP